MPVSRRKIDRTRSKRGASNDSKAAPSTQATAAAVSNARRKQTPTKEPSHDPPAAESSSEEEEAVGSAEKAKGASVGVADDDLVDSEIENEQNNKASDSSASDSEESSEEEDQKPRSRGSRSRSKRSSDDDFIAKESEEESDDKESDEEVDSDEELEIKSKRTKKASFRNKTQCSSKQKSPSRASTRASAKKGLRSEVEKDEDSDAHDDDNGDDAETNQKQRVSPSRAAARKASKKVATLYDDENDDKSDDEPVRKTWSRSKKKSDDDEYESEKQSDDSGDDLEGENGAFIDEEASEQSDSDESSGHDRTRLGRSRAKKLAAVANVGDDFGTADDSSSDGEEQWQSPRLKTKTLQRSHPLDLDSSSESEAALSSPKMPDCPSKFDVITNEVLPVRHVCYWSPDGLHRQCFALETLHKIAMSTPHPEYRQDLTGGGQQTFLQPPHFRSKMSANLLDQIASRFGRGALDLFGPFYDQKIDEKMDSGQRDSEDDEESDYVINHSEALADSKSFIERVGNYAKQQMGSQDIYACPLCYTVAHRRMRVQPDWSYDDDKEEEVEAELVECDIEFRYDPIHILGSLGDGYFNIASSFCFTRVAKLKNHLRHAHRVDTKEVDSNGLYERFKVRESDGLLQRYLGNNSMQSYWMEGNNLDFVYLLHMIDHVALCHGIVQLKDTHDADTVKEAQEYLKLPEEYFESFPQLALKLWEVLSGPYRSEKDLGDFLVFDEVEEDGDPVAAHRALDTQVARQSMDSEQQIMEHLRNQHEKEEDHSIDSKEESLDDDDNPDDVKNGGNFEQSSSEEEDDWVSRIKNKKRDSLGSRTSVSPRKRAGTGFASGSSMRKRRGKLKSGDSSDDEVFETAVDSVARKRVIDDDSDSDDS